MFVAVQNRSLVRSGVSWHKAGPNSIQVPEISVSSCYNIYLVCRKILVEEYMKETVCESALLTQKHNKNVTIF